MTAERAPTVDACIVAVGAISGLGEGVAAFRGGDVGEPARFSIARDAALESAGLTRPFASRARPLAADASSNDHATRLLAHALTQALATLDEARPTWRGERIGIALGTSSGGMLSAETYLAARDASGAAGDRPSAALAGAATYFAPFDDALAAAGLGLDAGVDVVRRTQILAACAASAVAVGLGLRWLRRGACDVVLAGGYDAVSAFVASGFEALRATTASEPRPFRVGRDGMSLGEGSGVVALVRSDDVRRARVFGRIAGFGASTDAVHITAPDRTGAGLARAARAALRDANLAADAVGLVSAHGTSTPFNDAMEAKAIHAVFEGGAPPVVHPFKAQIGHTLGAAGVLEMLAAADALARGIAPATRTSGDVDAEADVPLLECAEARSMGAALKLSAAFGGSNAALVVTGADRPSTSSAPPLRTVVATAHAHVTSSDLEALSAETGVARDRLARLDALCRLGVSAVAALAKDVGRARLAGAGVVAGCFLATLDTNARFDARRRARGAAFVEARLFAATSPNALPGECAIVYGLTGPSFAIGAGPGGALEALASAAELIAAGDADRIVVVAADDAGDAAQDLVRDAGWTSTRITPGAVAVLLEAGEGEGARVALDMSTTAAPEHAGHLALLAWLAAAGATTSDRREAAPAPKTE